MTNAELIKALRYCADPDYDCRDGKCPYYEKQPQCSMYDMMEAAADALEAADKRIAELSLDCEVLQQACTKLEDDKKVLIKVIQDKSDFHRTKDAMRIAELEAQLPKEGEWIESNTRPRSAQFCCSVCHRTCYDIQPTRDKAWTKRCRYHYCPNCGARMKKGEQNGET